MLHAPIIPYMVRVVLQDIRGLSFPRPLHIVYMSARWSDTALPLPSYFTEGDWGKPLLAVVLAEVYRLDLASRSMHM